MVVHMAESRSSRWPQFKLVTFPEPTGFPREWATPLLERGAPKNLLGHRFHAADTLTLLEAPPFGQFVRFAAHGLSDRLCLDPRTGQIMVIRGRLPEAEPWPVNSSMEQFIESVRLISARFPFDGGLPEAVGDLDDRGFKAYRTQLDNAVDELRAS
jgi:SUKH-4 immunity protein